MSFNYFLTHKFSETDLFNNIYLNLRNKFFSKNTSKVAEQNSIINSKIDEKLLKVIWYETNFNKEKLITIDGKKITVISSGDWNLGPGPDFINAVIKINDQIFHGDIEIDINQAKWKSHKHHIDKKFENVILHIFFYNDRKKNQIIRTSNNKEINQLNLSLFTDENFYINKFSFDQYPYYVNAGTGDCAKKVNSTKLDFLFFLLNSAGDTRILIKSNLYNKSKNIERILYENLSEAFGYSENKIGFKMLSRKLPITYLRKLLKDKEISSEQIYHLQSIFFNIGNLIPPKSDKFDSETNEYIEKLTCIWDKFYKRKFKNINKYIPKPVWVFRTRPFNNPLRRIAGLTYFINEYINYGLINLGSIINEKFLIASEKQKLDVLDLLKILTVHPKGYFAKRGSFNSKIFSNKVHLIGKHKGLVILVNVFLPFLLYLAKKNNDIEHEKKLHKLYIQLPVLEENKYTKFLKHKLFGNIKNIPLKKERLQQGVLQIFNDFCIGYKHKCNECSFPQILDLSPEEIEKEFTQ